MKVSFEKWSAAERAAVAAINAFGKLGIHTQAGDPESTLALLQTVRARAFDAHHNQSPRGEADMYAEDGEEELDSADLQRLLGAIEKELQAGTLKGSDSKFFRRLANQIRAYLQAANDSDTMRGRSTRDMLRNGNDPLKLVEDGAGPAMRGHLRRNRQLAARAKDTARGFLMRQPESGSDLAWMENCARRSYNL